MELMRILVHDFGGYPFPAQLARALAIRGHEVAHAWCASLATTPQGSLKPGPDDPSGLSRHPLYLRSPLEKYSFARRWRQEREYGRLIAKFEEDYRPEVVLSADTPLDAQAMLLRASRRTGARFVFWLQDLIGEAAARLLRQKVPVVGGAVGDYYRRMEGRLLRQSDHVVGITDDFRPYLERLGVAPDRITVVENWAPLEALPVRPADNAWAGAHGLDGKFCFLYSGTLGMKHNPTLLLALARQFADRPEVRVVVVSQGLGADWLRNVENPPANLMVLPFQPFHAMPDVLGAASVLVSVLEPDAGVFSVPSKVLSYLCAARPVLLAVPPENLAARLVRQHDAGLTVPPTDEGALLAAAETLYRMAPAEREAMGRRGRAYAEEHFDIDRIAARFEALLAGTRASKLIPTP